MLQQLPRDPVMCCTLTIVQLIMLQNVLV